MIIYCTTSKYINWFKGKLDFNQFLSFSSLSPRRFSSICYWKFLILHKYLLLRSCHFVSNRKCEIFCPYFLYFSTYLSSAVDFAASDLGGEVSVSSLSWSDPDPSIGIALEQSTVGIPFRVLIRTLVNLSLLGKIPRTSINRKKSPFLESFTLSYQCTENHS